MWAVDGNFQLSRHHKGGGRTKDPTLFRHWSYWVDQAEFDEYIDYWQKKSDKNGSGEVGYCSLPARTESDLKPCPPAPTVL